MPLLSVVIPVYNERETIINILKKIEAVAIDKEIVIVDNYSNDGTQDVLRGLESKESIRVIYHNRNLGKGTSVRDGIVASCGEYVVIQDADLEYDPADYLNLIKPLLNHQAELVLGARFTKSRRGALLHKMGNRFLTGLINFLFCARINDYATCYKLAKRETFNGLLLKSKSFDVEVEIVCKALKRKLKINEIPIAYYPRSYSQGKKIRWIDGIQAIIAILKYRFL